MRGSETRLRVLCIPSRSRPKSPNHNDRYYKRAINIDAVLFWCHDFRDDNYAGCYETRDTAGKESRSTSIVGRRIRELREELGWSQEKIGVAIGIDESSSRARISRYELGVHEPPVPTARLIAHAMGVPLTYLYCEDDSLATLLLPLHRLGSRERAIKVRYFLGQLALE